MIYVALFRGINVGGKNLLPMKDLVRLLQDLGCVNVRTYIQSGNAVFESTGKRLQALKKTIAQAINRQSGFDPEVLLLTVGELQAAANGNPFDSNVPKALHLFFMTNGSQFPETTNWGPFRTEGEQFTIHQNVLYLYTPNGVGQSKLAAKIGTATKSMATARNWNTIVKLIELAQPAAQG